MTVGIDAPWPPQRLRTALAGAGLVAVSGVLAAVDPHEPGRLPAMCPMHALTGLDCPGCGGVRLIHDVLHADLRAAVHDNLLLLVLIPVLVFGWAVRRVAARRGQAKPVPAWFGYALLGLAVVWGVVRNVPGWPLQPLTR